MSALATSVVPNADTKFYFVGIDKARFRKPVEPGDQLILTAKVARSFKGIWRLSGRATVDDPEAATAEIMSAPDVGGMAAAAAAGRAGGDKP